MFLTYKTLSITWAGIILILTLIPGKAVPNIPIFGFDKVVHFIIFGTLLFLTLNALKNQQNFHPVIASFFLCISYGIIIEVLQNFIPGRSFSVYDMIANTIGVVAGYCIFKIFSKK